MSGIQKKQPYAKQNLRRSDQYPVTLKMRTLFLVLSLVFMRSLAQPWAYQRGKEDPLNTGTAKGQGFLVGYGGWSGGRPYNDRPSFHYNEGRKRLRVKRDLTALAAKIATNAAFGSAFAAGVGVKAYVIQVCSLMQSTYLFIRFHG